MDRRFRTLALVMLAALGLGFGCARATSTAAAANDDAVLQGIQRRARKLSRISMDAWVTMNERNLKGGDDFVVRWFANVSRDGDRFSLETSAYQLKDRMWHELNNFAGKTLWMLKDRHSQTGEWTPDVNTHAAWRVDAQGFITSIRQDEMVAGLNSLRRNGEWLDGRLDESGKPWEDALARGDGKKVSPAAEKIDGHDCRAVDVRTDGARFMVWVDPACDFAPRRLAYHCESVSTAPDSDESWADTVEVEVSGIELAPIGGTWVPVAGKMLSRLKRVSKESGKVVEDESSYTVRRANVVINPTFPPGRFAMPYPEGTGVTDMDTQRTYRILNGQLLGDLGSFRRD